MMTVRELMGVLKDMPQGLQVVVDLDHRLEYIGRGQVLIDTHLGSDYVFLNHWSGDDDE